MKKHPLVSIITPTFNSSKYIRETLESVRNQDYKNIQHIVIDGGSSDKTLDIVREYEHIEWVSEPDKGMYDAINKGFKLVKGDIITYINSDDLYFPYTISKIVESYMKAKYDVFIGYCTFIDEKGRILYTYKFPYLIKNICLKLRRMPFCQSATFWTRKRQKKVGFFNNNYKYSGDFEFFIRLLSTNKISVIRIPIAKFRIHTNQLSKNTKKIKKENKMILKQHNIEKFYAFFLFRIYYELAFKIINIKAILRRYFTF